LRPEFDVGALGHTYARVETHIYSRSPKAAFYADSDAKDQSNWWRPSRAKMKVLF
jgi:hypothetical protein